MGLDFIRMRAGSFKKAWRRGSEDLARVDLFTRHPECLSRTVIASLGGNSNVTPGQQVILQCTGDTLTVYQEHSQIGSIAHPPAELARAIKDNGGVALGEITQLNSFSRTVDVCVLK